MIERERIRRETEENQERLEKNKKQARERNRRKITKRPGTEPYQ